MIAGMALTMSLLGGLTGCQKTDNQSTSNQSPSNSEATNTISSKNSVSSNTVINTQLPTVYATTNVWGSVAKAVGGDKVNVIVGVDDLSQDPHDYQATATDKLNITKSAVMLVNGGGYDDWGMSLAESVSHKPVVINAVALSGLSPNTDNAADEPASEPHQHKEAAHDDVSHHQAEHPHHAHGDFNEHVFFSLDTAKKWLKRSISNWRQHRLPIKRFMQKIPNTLSGKLIRLKSKPNKSDSKKPSLPLLLSLSPGIC